MTRFNIVAYDPSCMEKKPKEIKVRVPEDLEPVYANQAIINHKDDEFTFSFMHVLPQGRGTMKAVVALTPQHAKRFLNALSDNIQKYEASYGKIMLPEEQGEAGEAPQVQYQ